MFILIFCFYGFQHLLQAFNILQKCFVVTGSIYCCFNKRSNKDWKFYISFIVDVLVLEKQTAKTSFQRKFQSVRAAKICSYKPRKKKNRQSQGRIQNIQKEGAESPARMKTSLFRTCSNKVTLMFQNHFENTRKKGGRGPLDPSPKSAYESTQ